MLLTTACLRQLHRQSVFQKVRQIHSVVALKPCCAGTQGESHNYRWSRSYMACMQHAPAAPRVLGAILHPRGDGRLCRGEDSLVPRLLERPVGGTLQKDPAMAAKPCSLHPCTHSLPHAAPNMRV